MVIGASSWPLLRTSVPATGAWTLPVSATAASGVFAVWGADGAAGRPGVAQAETNSAAISNMLATATSVLNFGSSCVLCIRCPFVGGPRPAVAFLVLSIQPAIGRRVVCWGN